ncbi:hypothetical protein N9Y41_04465 [Planktomarina temperata]|nr:hypothetical protein [Planktomarina temperata]
MFFNRHIKQGKEIGQNTLQMLTSATQATEFDEMGRFKPTKEFFADPYVSGFLINFIGFTITFGLGGGNWSSSKKGECIASALSVIDPYNQLKQILIGNLKVDQEQQKTGLNDGATAIGVIYKTLNENDQDPKYIEAKSLAEEMHSFNSAISLQDSLSSAIMIVTLREYIQKRWNE